MQARSWRQQTPRIAEDPSQPCRAPLKLHKVQDTLTQSLFSLSFAGHETHIKVGGLPALLAPSPFRLTQVCPQVNRHVQFSVGTRLSEGPD